MLLLAGCGGQRVNMYRGEALPPGATATISGYFDRDGMMVTIESVDTIPVPGQSWFRGGLYNRDTIAVIAPGPRQVAIRFWGFVGAETVQSRGSIPLKFEAEAGHDYEVRVARDPGARVAHPETLQRVTLQGLGSYASWVVWIIDLDTAHRLPLLEIGAPGSN